LPEATYGFAAITTLCGNDEACLLAPESRHASRAHEIVARAVHPHGVLVLNADDQAVLELADRATSRIVLFALHPENPALRRARAQGLPALWYQDGLIVADQALLTLASRLPRPLRYETDSAAASPQGNGTDFFGTPPNESREYPIIDVREAPCTLGGALLFQIQNIMCASALALSLGIPATTVAAVIRTFLPDTRALPGSCNVLSLRGHAVLVDGARYPWTLRSLVRGIRHRNPRKTFVLTHSFPWLNEEELREVGRLLGRLNGLIVFAEPIDEKRYRAFQDGVVQNPYPPVLAAQSDLEQALRYALSLAQPGDLCLVLAADPSRTIELLERIL
jgi:cyanophycin synthetase